MRRTLLIVGFAAVSGFLASGPEGAKSTNSAPPAPDAQQYRALLDKYCVTCHSDKLKTSNLTLQSQDIHAVADHPEVWERVIRKLRAGMMPPPGMNRPPL